MEYNSSISLLRNTIIEATIDEHISESAMDNDFDFGYNVFGKLLTFSKNTFEF